MIVFGGRQGGSQDPDRLFNDIWVLDFATEPPRWNQLQPTGAGPGVRWLHAAGYDEVTNRMVLFGGMGGSVAPCLNDSWVLSHANGAGTQPPAWTATGASNAPPPRAAFPSGAAYDRMIVAGGTDCAGWPYRDGWLLQDVGVPSGPRWTNPVVGGTALPTNFRLSGASVFDAATDRTIIWGGPPASMALNRLLVLRGMFGPTPDWFFVDVPTGPQVQANFGKPGIFNPENQRLVFFGGISPGPNEVQNASGASNQTWRLESRDQYFAGAQWTQIFAGNPPAARTGHTAVWDKALDRMIVFGGASTASDGRTTTFDDVWILAGATGSGPAGSVRVTPSALSFGGIVVGTTSPVQVVSVTNLGTAVLTVNNIAVTGSFEQTNTCGTSLLPSQMCAVSVVFKPRESGAQNAELTIAHSGSPAPERVALSGTGICPSGGCVTLSATFTINGNADSAAPFSAAVGQTLTFHATDQTPAATYDWDFGDGSPRAGARMASHAFGRAGSYVVRLSVSLGSQSVSGSRAVIVSGSQQPKRRSVRTPDRPAARSTSALVRSFAGGTVSAPEGGNVSIGAGALTVDQLVTVEALTGMPSSPPSGLLVTVGPALSVTFGAAAAASAPGAPRTSPGTMVLTLDLSRASGELAGAAPMLEIRNPGLAADSRGVFVGVRGSVDMAARAAQMTISTEMLRAFGIDRGGPPNITLIAGLVNWSPAVSALHRAAATEAGLRYWQSDQRGWEAPLAGFMPGISARTCVFVHGVESSVEKAFPGTPGPGETESCVARLKRANQCDAVFGFNYNWSLDIRDSGAQLAAALDSLHGAGARNFLIEGHSLGGVVSMAAASRARNNINLEALVTLGSPIMGTPAASAAESLLTTFAYTTGIGIPLAALYTNNLGLFLSEFSVKGDLRPDSTILQQVRLDFVRARPDTQLVFVAGMRSCLPSLVSGFLFGSDTDDCIVGHSSASGQLFERPFRPPVRPAPFTTLSHVQLECSESVIATVKDHVARPAATATIVVQPESLEFSAVQGGPNPANRVLTVTNGGSANSTLTLSSPIETTASSWLSVAGPISPLAAGQSHQLDVIVNISGLTADGSAPKTYEANIVLRESPPAGQTGQVKIVPVRLTLQPRAATGKPTASVRFTQDGPLAARIIVDYSDAEGDAKEHELESSAYAIFRNPAGDRTSPTLSSSERNAVSNPRSGSDWIRSWSITNDHIAEAQVRGDTAITLVMSAKAVVVDLRANRSDPAEGGHRFDVSMSSVMVSIQPGEVRLAPGATQQFTARVTGTPNSSVTWTTNAGTISSAGLLTVTAGPGEYFVRATSVADSSRRATVTVVVTNQASTGTVTVAVRGSGTMTNSDGETHNLQVDLQFRGIRFTNGSATGRFTFEPSGPLNYGTVTGTISANFMCNPCPVGVPATRSQTFTGQAVFGVTDTSRGLGFVGNDRSQPVFIGIWLSGGSSLPNVDSIWLIYPTTPNLSVYDYTRAGSIYGPYSGSVISGSANFTVTITPN